jgi:peptide-methionine (R)-S-oxide reductase
MDSLFPDLHGGLTMIDRRILLASAMSLAAFSAFRWLGLGGNANAGEKSAAKFEIEKTPEEWRKQLSAAQYNVLREAGTERPFTSPLNKEKRKGTFACAGCDLPLFSSETKFDSGTGWPSFYQALPNAIVEKSDRTMMMVRTETLCRRCGGHLGHVFDDGPKPTGLRYCMNGLALTFKPADGSST